MMAVLQAWARVFWRDRAGVVLSLVLPGVVYLLFAAVFGAGARGEISPLIGVVQAPPSALNTTLVDQLTQISGRSPRQFPDARTLEQEVVEGGVDVGVVARTGSGRLPSVVVIAASGSDAAANIVQVRLERVFAHASGRGSPPSLVGRATVGPQGDMQGVYYAGAVSVMFVFFAAMHGALTGLDERKSGLQARMVLACGGHGRILAGRLGWLTTVAVLQSASVFGLAWPQMPSPSLWQTAAGLATAVFTGLAAGGVALALVSICRSREQAQPLTTFVALLTAALGGSMAPRFLMPDEFRAAGLLTPHAWTIEAYQRIFWLGRLDRTVVLSWLVLACVAVVSVATALFFERRRLG